MKHKSIIVPLIVFVLAIGITGPVFAQNNSSDATSRSPQVTPADLAENTVRVAEKRTEKIAERASDRAKLVQQRISEKRANLKERLEARKADGKERLEGQRLERCQNREVTINQLIQKSADNGQRHLDRLQKYEQIILDFANKQSLDTAEISTSAAAASESKENAASTLATLSEQQFKCDDVDGAKPNGLIRDINHERIEALKSYRNDVKDLLLAVKDALNDKEAA